MAEVPLALPEIMAGLRMGATTTVGLATLVFLLARADSVKRSSRTSTSSRTWSRQEVSLLLAAVLDGLILLVQHAITPLTRRGGAMSTTIAFLGQFGDAVDFVFNERESPAGQVGGLAELWELTWEHLKLSGVAMAIACAISIPLGLWLGHIGKGGFLAINASNVGRAVPSLALIAFFVAYLGVGFTNLTPRSCAPGDPAHPHQRLHRRAPGGARLGRRRRGMGMTGAQIVRRVELPLALPLIFGGIRISAVNVIATATIAPLAGVVTLGDPIINVNTYGDEGGLRRRSSSLSWRSPRRSCSGWRSAPSRRGA